MIYKKLKWQARDPLNKVWYVLFVTIKMTYKCFYFYFFPFMSFVINITSPRCTAIPNLNPYLSYLN